MQFTVGIKQGGRPHLPASLPLLDTFHRGDLAAHRLEITSGSDYAGESDDHSPTNFSPTLSKHQKFSSAKGTPSERMHRLSTKIKSKKLDPKDGGDGGSGSTKSSPARPSSSKDAAASASAVYDAEKLKEKRTARTMYPPSSHHSPSHSFSTGKSLRRLRRRKRRESWVAHPLWGVRISLRLTSDSQAGQEGG